MLAEPYKLKTIRNLVFTDFQERIDALMEVDYNTFNIPSYLVTFDMTSQGTSAVSQDQFSGLFIGDETYAGSRNFENLVDNVKEILSELHKKKYSHVKFAVAGSCYLAGDILSELKNKPRDNRMDDPCALSGRNSFINRIPRVKTRG